MLNEMPDTDVAALLRTDARPDARPPTPSPSRLRQSSRRASLLDLMPAPPARTKVIPDGFNTDSARRAA